MRSRPKLVGVLLGTAALGIWAAQLYSTAQAAATPPSPAPFNHVEPVLGQPSSGRKEGQRVQRNDPVLGGHTAKSGPHSTLPIPPDKEPPPPAPSPQYWIWTGTFNPSCSANWNEKCEGEQTVTVDSGYEYCSHSWTLTTLNNYASFAPVRTTTNGFTYHIFAQGSGSFFDQWGSSVGVTITLRGITAGVSELVRQKNSCQSAQVFGKDVWACVRTGGNVNAVRNCLSGPGACEYFPELIFMRCVNAPALIPPDLRQACIGINGIGGQGTELYVPNSPQCH